MPKSLDFEALSPHLHVSQYGSFELTDAVRPSFDLRIIPRQGFRRDHYEESGKPKIPVLMAAATRDRLFDLFIDMLEPLGGIVDVVLTSSHNDPCGQDMWRDDIDTPVLKSILYDFEDLLLNDGCTGIAVINCHRRQEIQFDDHKLIVAYGSPLVTYERIFIRHDVYPDDDIRFITEAQHSHSTSDEYVREFRSLRDQLKAGGAAS